MTSTPPPVAPTGPRRGSTNRSWTSRTSLLTSAAIAGVLFAGTAAVAANIGILNAADNSDIGKLAATDELTAPTTTVDATAQMIALEDVTTTTTTDAPDVDPTGDAAQRYDIDSAGTVWVLSTTSGLALDHVEAQPGWTAALSQTDLRSLRIDFTNGARTITFTAVLADDGSIVVDVVEPIVMIEQSTAAPAGGSTGAVGGYDDDEYDDDEYEDDDDHEDDHEDDDDHEYEGADDDD